MASPPRAGPWGPAGAGATPHGTGRSGRGQRGEVVSRYWPSPPAPAGPARGRQSWGSLSPARVVTGWRGVFLIPRPLESRRRGNALPFPRFPSVSTAPGAARPASSCSTWRCPARRPGPPPPLLRARANAASRGRSAVSSCWSHLGSLSGTSRAVPGGSGRRWGLPWENRREQSGSPCLRQLPAARGAGLWSVSLPRLSPEIGQGGLGGCRTGIDEDGENQKVTLSCSSDK